MTAERRPVVVITGASSGIGAALAHEFAAHGHELVLIARREQALTNVADAIAAKGAPRPTVLRLDVGRIDAARDISEALAQRGLELDIVVNNAGFGLMGAADKLDRQRQLAMIDINVRALTELSLAFIESIERRKGGILNVASISGFMPGPGMAVYHATKAYVISFSEALYGTQAARCARHHALPGASTNGIPGTCRHGRQSDFGVRFRIRRGRRQSGLRGAQARPPHGRAGLGEQSRAGIHAHSATLGPSQNDPATQNVRKT